MRTRLPFLDQTLQRLVYRAIEAQCAELRTPVLAIGGAEDHGHVLVELPATLAVADLVKQVNGAWSNVTTHRLAHGPSFKGRAGYAAFSVSPRHIDAVRDDILGQVEHHARGALIAAREPVDTSDAPDTSDA